MFGTGFLSINVKGEVEYLEYGNKFFNLECINKVNGYFEEFL